MLTIMPNVPNCSGVYKRVITGANKKGIICAKKLPETSVNVFLTNLLEPICDSLRIKEYFGQQI